MLPYVLGAVLFLALGYVLRCAPSRPVAAMLALAALVAPVSARAQESEEARVLAAVQRLFDGMAARDTALAASALEPDAWFFATRPGAPPVGTPTRDFLERLAVAEVPWRERLWSPEVRVHGDIAMVWAPYDFHVGERFSHCGVDAFTLVRGGGRWRISGATYTVEPDPGACDPGRPR